MGISEGMVPAAKGVGWGGTGAEEALAMMDEMGTAVGFSDTKEKEGVGNEVFTAAEVREILEPETTEAPEEVEAAEVAETTEVVGPDEAAPLDETTS